VSDLVLGIDTSVRVSVGLADGERVMFSSTVGDTRSHVEKAALAVEEILNKAGARLADVARIVVGVGPGPFTGLRVGIVTAQGLGEALHVPVTGVCGLDAVALASCRIVGREFAVVADARRREVYWARYDASGLRLEGPFVSRPVDLPSMPVVGPGLETYPDLAPGVAACQIDAGFMAANLPALPDVGLEPLYLRQPDAELPSTRKSTLVSGHLRLPIGNVARGGAR